MGKLVAILCALVFAGLLSGAAVASNEVNVCVPVTGDGSPRKNAKFKRVKIDVPTDCKSRQEPVTLPTDKVTDDLQAQINALRDAGISSMFGGGHFDFLINTADGQTFYFPATSAGFLQVVESNAHSKSAATGWITKITAVTDLEPGIDDSLEFTLRINGINAPLDPNPAAQCVISGTNTMCETTGCVEVDMGDLINMRVKVSTPATADISPTRVVARFVETEADCPLPASP